jgi:hypothetical protein
MHLVGIDRRTPPARISPSLERDRFCRGRECRNSLSLGRQSTRSIIGPSNRLGSPTGGCDRRDRKQPRGVASQGSNLEHPYCFFDRSHFGLTAIARTRLANAGFDPPPGGRKFAGLLAGED